MIKIEKEEVIGFEAAIRGMRNPYDSWDKIDSFYDENGDFIIGPNDKKVMTKLSNAGPVESKYLRMIIVYADVTAPLYWWKEYDTYKVGTVANSCSTMHTIHKKKFSLDDFSHEHLINDTSKIMLESVIQLLNQYRSLYLDTKDKEYWWQMIQLLPSSYNQKRTIQLNYEVLANMYKSRKTHKLDEWVHFCKWVETLPYSELITKPNLQPSKSLNKLNKIKQIINDSTRIQEDVLKYKMIKEVIEGSDNE